MSLYCPLTSVICTLGQNLARCPRTTLEVGWWLRGFRRASSMVLAQRAHHCQLTSKHPLWTEVAMRRGLITRWCPVPLPDPAESWYCCCVFCGKTKVICLTLVAPCVVCVLGLPQLVVLAAARQLLQSPQLGDFPRKDAGAARLPPPASRHAQPGNRSYHLSVARCTLSPVELAGDPCLCARMCVGREACYGGHVPIKVLDADAKGTGHDCEGDTPRQLKQITRLTTYTTHLLKRGRGILRRTPDYYGLLWRARSSRVLWQG